MICCIFGGSEDCGFEGIIPEDAYVIAADGGYKHCLDLKIIPDLILGDFDSLEGGKPEGLSQPIISASRDKDDTDTMLAVKEGLARGCTEFRLYGVMGGRLGHTAANIQTLCYILEQGAEGKLYGDSGSITLLGSGKHRIINDNYRYISLFSYSESVTLFAKGLKYSGNITLREDFPLGVSNEFTENSAEIEVFQGKLLVICEKQ